MSRKEITVRIFLLFIEHNAKNTIYYVAVLKVISIPRTWWQNRIGILIKLNEDRCSLMKKHEFCAFVQKLDSLLASLNTN